MLTSVRPARLDHVTHAAGGGMRIRGSHVGDQRHAAPVARREHSLHAFAKKRIEAGLWIARLRLLRQGDRALGQALEHEVVEVAAFDQFDGGLNAVV